MAIYSIFLLFLLYQIYAVHLSYPIKSNNPINFTFSEVFNECFILVENDGFDGGNIANFGKFKPCFHKVFLNQINDYHYLIGF